jgi:hypothetical protein
MARGRDLHYMQLNESVVVKIELMNGHMVFVGMRNM